MHVIRTEISQEDLGLSEKIWMSRFANLVNERCRIWKGYQQHPQGKEIEQRCKAETSKRRDNFDGFHGVTYFPDKDAYQVTVSYGYANEFSRRIYVKGDSLPVIDSEPFWFQDMNRAVNARNRVRDQLISRGEIGMHRPYKWPEDIFA